MAITRSFPFNLFIIAFIAFGLTACQTGRGGSGDVDGTGNGIFDGGNGADPPNDPFSGEDAVSLELRVLVNGQEVEVPVTIEVAGETKTVQASEGITLDESLIAEATFIAGSPADTTDDGRPLVFTSTNIDNVSVADPDARSGADHLKWFTALDGAFTWVDDNVVTIALIPYFKATAMKCEVTVGSTVQPYNIGDIEVLPDGSFELGLIGDNSWLADDSGIDLSYVTSVAANVTQFELGVKSLDFTYQTTVPNDPPIDVACDWQ